MFSCEVCEIFENIFFYRTPLMAVSVICWSWSYSLTINKKVSVNNFEIWIVDFNIKFIWIFFQFLRYSIELTSNVISMIFECLRLKSHSISKGAVIFNAGYQGGRKLPLIWKLQQLGSRRIKSIGRPRPGYENLVSNSSKRPPCTKTAGKFFTGWETFQVKFEECNF